VIRTCIVILRYHYQSHDEDKSTTVDRKEFVQLKEEAANTNRAFNYGFGNIYMFLKGFKYSLEIISVISLVVGLCKIAMQDFFGYIFIIMGIWKCCHCASPDRIRITNVGNGFNFYSSGCDVGCRNSNILSTDLHLKLFLSRFLTFFWH